MNTLEITQPQNFGEYAALSTQAAALRTRLMNLESIPHSSWHSRALPQRAPFGLVDIRQAAPTLQVLDAPRWSAPRGRFWVRPEVATRLNRAADFLPTGYSLGFWEGYRPPVVQQALWETGLVLLRETYPHLLHAEIETVLETFVARPTPTAPHTLGGAVDVALLNGAGRVLDAPEEISLLSDALVQTGLSNYEPEWWHWSYEEDGKYFV